MIKNNVKREEGFTLIELLIAVLILGIVSTIAVIGIGGVFSSSKHTACQTDVRTLDNAMQAYYNDHYDSTSGQGNNPVADAGAPAANEEILYNTTAGGTYYPFNGSTSAGKTTNDLVNLKYFTPFDPNNNYVIHLQLFGGSGGTPAVPEYKIIVTKPNGTAIASIIKDANGQINGDTSATPTAGTFTDICKGV